MGTGVESRRKDAGLAIKVLAVPSSLTIGEQGCIIRSAGTEPSAYTGCEHQSTIATEETIAPIVVVGNPALNVLAIYLSILERLNSCWDLRCRSCRKTSSVSSHAEPRSLLKIAGPADNVWKGTLRFYQRRGGHIL